jgi:hypothetical protein
MSTLSLAKNGYVSSSKRTKHIKAKYLYLRHYHESGDLSLQYCPTGDMWADILTKPLQGSKLRHFRTLLMNCPENYTVDPPFLPLHPLSSNVPIKPRPSSPKLKLPKPLPRECVASHVANTKVSVRPSTHGLLVTIPLKPMRKDVSWSDALFPCQHSNNHSFPKACSCQDPSHRRVVLLVSLNILISQISNVNLLE